MMGRNSIFGVKNFAPIMKNIFSVSFLFGATVIGVTFILLVMKKRIQFVRRRSRGERGEAVVFLVDAVGMKLKLMLMEKGYNS